jgi:hypothetical protein
MIHTRTSITEVSPEASRAVQEQLASTQPQKALDSPLPIQFQTQLLLLWTAVANSVRSFQCTTQHNRVLLTGP